jgi:hypothetical protein
VPCSQRPPLCSPKAATAAPLLPLLVLGDQISGDFNSGDFIWADETEDGDLMVF